MNYLGLRGKNKVAVAVVEKNGEIECTLIKSYASDEDNGLSNIMKYETSNPFFIKIPDTHNEYLLTSEATINIINKDNGIYFDVTFAIGKSIWNFTGETSSNKTFQILKKHIELGKELIINLYSPSYDITIRGIQNHKTLKVDAENLDYEVLTHVVTIK